MSAVVSHESAALSLPGEIGETGLSLPQGLAYDEWESVGSRLQGADDSLKWWIGDWLAYGERKYGETYAAAIEKTGYGVERLRKYKWVAERVPPQNRYSGPGFSWSKHRAVASLDTLAQPKVLEAAVEHGWSSADIAKRIKAAEAGNTKAFTADWQPSPRVSSQTVDEGDAPDADTPVMDAGAFGEGLSAERAEREPRDKRDLVPAFEQVAKAIDHIERLTVQDEYSLREASVNPERIRAAGRRLVQIADDIARHFDNISKSSSRVEHTAPTAAPCEAPAVQTPAVSIPVQTPVGGGSPLEDPERPDYLTERLAREGAL